MNLKLFGTVKLGDGWILIRGETQSDLQAPRSERLGNETSRIGTDYTWLGSGIDDLLVLRIR